MQLTVALVAEEAAGARALQLLVDRGHRVAAAFTCVDELSPVAARAKSLGVSVRDVGEVGSPGNGDLMRDQGVELVLNVHSLHIIDAGVLAVPTLGAYNLHPGPLPERAGLHAPSWALYEGVSRHGVTLHRMTPVIDAGAIAFAEHFAIGRGDTGLSLMVECVRRGMRLIEQLLGVAEHGEPIPARPQDLARRRWFGAGPPDQGRLDWRRPARSVANFVRACDYRPFDSPWGFPRCRAGDTDVGIRTARVVRRPMNAAPGTVVHTDGAAILVAAGDGWVRVDQVELDGHAVVATEAIRDGIRLR